MNAPSPVSSAARLLRLYQRLVAENRSFLADTHVSQDRLQTLLDQRDQTAQEIGDLEAELRLTCSGTDASSAELPIGELIKLSQTRGTETGSESLLEEIRGTLRELIASDQEIENRLAENLVGLKEEIKAIKRGTTQLRGYLQANPSGSCFIDKIK